QMMPAMRMYEVTDRFSTGMYEYDSNYMYVPISAAQDLLEIGDGVGGVGVTIRDAWQAQETAEWLQQELRFPNYTQDWVQLNASLFSALKLEKLAMAVILF